MERSGLCLYLVRYSTVWRFGKAVDKCRTTLSDRTPQNPIGVCLFLTFSRLSVDRGMHPRTTRILNYIWGPSLRLHVGIGNMWFSGVVQDGQISKRGPWHGAFEAIPRNLAVPWLCLGPWELGVTSANCSSLCIGTCGVYSYQGNRHADTRCGQERGGRERSRARRR